MTRLRKLLRDSVIVVLLVSFFSWLTLRSVHICGMPSKKQWARIQARFLAEELAKYRDEFGALPEGTNAKIIRALNGENPKGIEFLYLKAFRLSPNGECLDPWGTPYRIGHWEPQNPWVYSCGPNRKDEAGVPRSDDIASWR